MNKKHYKPACWTAALLLVFSLGFSALLYPGAYTEIQAQDTSDGQEFVKVGFFQFDGYHEQKDNGEKSGYGYELLQFIGAYAGLNFEYVGYENSWEEMQQMLLDGQIDMVTSASKSDTRAELFDFSEHSVGETETILTCKASNTKFEAGVYVTYNGMVVGALPGSTRNDRLNEFARNHNFDFTFRYYDSQAALNQALAEGEIDAIISSNLRYLNNETVLNVIDTSPTYVMVKKGNTALLKKVDMALARLDSYNPSWKSHLYSKYYQSSSKTDFAFTAAEHNYLNILNLEGQKLKVLYNPARSPYCFTEKNQAKGALVESFIQAAEAAGLPYEFMKCSTPAEYFEAVQKGEADIVIDSALDLSLTEKYGYYPTVPIASTTYARIQLKGHQGDIKTIARVEGSRDEAEVILEHHPSATVMYYPTLNDCLDAVVNGEVDCVYTYATKAVNFPAVDNRLEVITAQGSSADLRSLVNRNAGSPLYGIVCKLAGSVSESEINDLVTEYASLVSWKPSLWETLRQTPHVLITLVIIAFILLGLAVAGFVLYILNEKKHQRREEEAQEERRRILEEKESSDESLKLINDIINSGLWYFDYDENGQMTSVYWSDTFRHMIGYDNEEDFPNEFESWKNCIHPDEHEKTIAEYEIGLANGVYDAKYRLKMKNGGYEWFNAKGKVVYHENGQPRRMMGTFFNITMAENESRDINSRLSTVIGGIHGGLKIARPEKGFPNVFISQEAAALQGYTPEEWLEACHGLTVDNILEEDRERAEAEVWEQFSKGSSHSLEYRIRHKDGTIMWVHDFGRKTVMPDGSELVYSLIQDITMDKKAAMALEEASAAKTNFLSAMSHDIRTPMNAVIGLVDIALRHQDEPERMIDSLVKIREAGNQLISLVNDVLDIASIESGKLVLRTQEHNIPASFDNYYSLFRTQLERKNQSGEFRLHEISSPWVIADDVRLKQIFTNLLSNAIKYTPEGGHILFEAYQETDENGVLQTVVAVEDDGIGMTEEFMERMWESFTRATDTRINKIQGAGLGLSIVRQLVDLMNGTIEVKSQLNKGTRFKITLPLQPVEHKNREEALDLENAEGPLNISVLLAEDNDMNWEIAEELLGLNGIQATRAENGKAALEMFKNSAPGTYDAILMDLQMPEMNGFEATMAIRSCDHPEAQTIPIIAMTANAFAEDVRRCREAGMNDHLSKPIDTKKVLRVLRRYTKRNG